MLDPARHALERELEAARATVARIEAALGGNARPGAEVRLVPVKARAIDLGVSGDTIKRHGLAAGVLTKRFGRYFVPHDFGCA